MLTVGSFFSFPTPPHGRHYFIAIAEVDPDLFLCVNLTTLKRQSEKACILSQGDHPVILHDSAINYKGARLITGKTISAYYRDSRCTIHNPVSDAVLNRIREGAGRSKRLKKQFKDLLEAYLNP